MNNKVKSAVALFIYKKDNSLVEILEKIAEFNPDTLYVVSDIGTTEGDTIMIEKNRSTVKNYTTTLNTIWIQPPTHQGIIKIFDYALAIVFEQEEQAIILEDDTIPSPLFFEFCSDMLNKYRTNQSIGSIIGTNLGAVNAQNQYFKTIIGLPYWGWATWADRWKKMPKDYAFWDTYAQSTEFKELLQVGHPFSSSFIRNRQLPKSWDLKWAMYQLSANMKSIIPGINLITNNGYNELATFTKLENSMFENIQFIDLTDENLNIENKSLTENYCLYQKKFIAEFNK